MNQTNLNTNMNFIRKSYLAVLSVLAATGAFTSCDKSENVAKAVMASANSLNFPGEEAAEQIITVYSDAEWTADVPEWVTIEPTTGSGTTDVTVSVGANMRDGALDSPRTAELIFHGKTLRSQAIVLVKQAGDKFRDVTSSTISQVVASDDKSVVIVNDAQVVALSTKGFVMSDGKANVYVASVNDEIKVGSSVEVWGTKTSDKGLPVISECDKVIAKSEGVVSYPEAKDITTIAATYTSDASEYITVKGLLKGQAVTIENSDMSVFLQDPIEDLKSADLNRHYVTISGYFVGTAKPYHNIVATAIEDRGKYFEMNEGFPIEWVVGKVEDETIKTFASTGSFVSTKGNGTISYVQDPANTALAADNFKFNVGGTGEPYVTGAWPGDYWEFKSDSPISSGTTIGVDFSYRVSAGGFKYWRLEYLDGTEWKVLGEPQKTTYNGSEVVYTHAMIAGGKINTQVRTQFTVTTNTESACVRFVLVSNVTAADKVQDAPSGNTTRISNRYDENDCNPSLTILENGGGDQPGSKTVVFEDDFSWLEPIVTAYNAQSDKPIGDTVNDKNKSAEAVNVYNDALKEAFFKLFTDQQGYEDMCPSEQVVYLQPGYLKFGRTGGHNTSIRLPKLNLSSDSDIDVEFDFAAMVQGTGVIDDTKLVVVVEGDGEFSNGTKYSDVIGQTQAKDEIFWTHAKTTVKGATANTRLVIVMYRVLEGYDTGNYTGKYNYNVSGAGRFFLDNIKISK